MISLVKIVFPKLGTICLGVWPEIGVEGVHFEARRAERRGRKPRARDGVLGVFVAVHYYNNSTLVVCCRCSGSDLVGAVVVSDRRHSGQAPTHRPQGTRLHSTVTGTDGIKGQQPSLWLMITWYIFS